MNDALKEFSESARQVVAGLGLDANERSAWSQLTELGWLLTPIPEALDGLGMGLPGACALHKELGRAVVPVPLISALFALDALSASGMPERSAWLARLGAGDGMLTAPLAESRLSVRFEETPILDGSAEGLASADLSSHFLLWTESADLVALVPANHAGVSYLERQTWDTSRRLFDVQLKAVSIGPESVLAKGPSAKALVERMLVWRDFALAAEAVGGAAALLSETIEYLGTRRQFGRPLAMFQSLKHRCADLKALVDAADALLQDSLARATDDDHVLQPGLSATRAGLSAKQLACTAFTTVAEESLQLHGGIGMTAEHLCHRYLKRALLDEHLGRGRDAYAMALAEHSSA